MTAAHETPQEEYRRERAPCSPEFQAELTRITGDIGDPVAKLRYLRGAIGEDVKSPVNWLPCAPARRAWYRFRGLEALDAVADTGTAASIGRETLAARRKARRVAAGALATGLLFVPALLAGLALQMDSRGTSSAVALPRTVGLKPDPQERASAPPLEPLSDALPPDTLGVVPTTIFLADRGPGWELYSNGL